MGAQVAFGFEVKGNPKTGYQKLDAAIIRQDWKCAACGQERDLDYLVAEEAVCSDCYHSVQDHAAREEMGGERDDLPTPEYYGEEDEPSEPAAVTHPWHDLVQAWIGHAYHSGIECARMIRNSGYDIAPTVEGLWHSFQTTRSVRDAVSLAVAMKEMCNSSRWQPLWGEIRFNRGIIMWNRENERELRYGVDGDITANVRHRILSLSYDPDLIEAHGYDLVSYYTDMVKREVQEYEDTYKRVVKEVENYERADYADSYSVTERDRKEVIAAFEEILRTKGVALGEDWLVCHLRRAEKTYRHHSGEVKFSMKVRKTAAALLRMVPNLSARVFGY